MGFKKKDKAWYGSTSSILIVSTATAKKGKSTMLFKKLLNFDVGISFTNLRNIEDVLIEEDSYERLEDILRVMGDGGIIYARDTEEVQKYYEVLKKDFKVGVITSTKKKDYERFRTGEINLLIGTTHYYGLLVRGLDIPERIKYVIFIGAPVIRIKYEELTPKMVKIIALSLKNNKKIKEYLPYLPSIEKDQSLFEELKKIIREIATKEKMEDIVLRENEIIFPDIRTYIQASGRESRLTVNGLTKGASFLFERDQEVLRSFVKRASYFDIEFKEIKDVNSRN